MMRIGRRAALAFILGTSLQCGLLQAAEWSQYRGPTHDGISTENVKLPWPAAGPATLWKVPTVNGFSSFSVGGGKAFTLISQDAEVCIALDALTGKQVWSEKLGEATYQGGGDSGTQGNKGGDGPRSTPSFSDGMVYVYTSDLVLHCLDANTGKPVWSVDMVKKYGGHNVAWSNAASPVIEGDLVYVAAGGKEQSFLAIHKKTGQVAWKSGSEQITHATPVVDTVLGQKQVIFFVQSGLVSLNPDTGKELWRYPFRYSTSTAASPVVCGDIVYCSAGYDVGGGACKITKNGDAFTAKEIWRTPGNKQVPNHWSTPVYKDGYLYGMFSFKRYGVGPVKCVEVATGKVMWDQPGFGAGNVILAHDKLLALADNGELVAIDPVPTGYKEICRTQAVTGKCWSTPALNDGKVYVRSVKEGACLDLSEK